VLPLTVPVTMAFPFMSLICLICGLACTAKLNREKIARRGNKDPTKQTRGKYPNVRPAHVEKICLIALRVKHLEPELFSPQRTQKSPSDRLDSLVQFFNPEQLAREIKSNCRQGYRHRDAHEAERNPCQRQARAEFIY
jgi:CxxC motif-containing protein